MTKQTNRILTEAEIMQESGMTYGKWVSTHAESFAIIWDKLNITNKDKIKALLERMNKNPTEQYTLQLNLDALRVELALQRVDMRKKLEAIFRRKITIGELAVIADLSHDDYYRRVDMVNREFEKIIQ